MVLSRPPLDLGAENTQSPVVMSILPTSTTVSKLNDEIPPEKNITFLETDINLQHRMTNYFEGEDGMWEEVNYAPDECTYPLERVFG